MYTQNKPYNKIETDIHFQLETGLKYLGSEGFDTNNVIFRYSENADFVKNPGFRHSQYNILFATFSPNFRVI